MGLLQKIRDYLPEQHVLTESESGPLDLVIAKKLMMQLSWKWLLIYKAAVAIPGSVSSPFTLLPWLLQLRKIFPTILNGIQFGVIPPLCKGRRLPFELPVCRVPVMCLNRGGALREFVCHPAFIFWSGNSCYDVIQTPYYSRSPTHHEFWLKARQSVPIEQHFQELMKFL